MKKGSKSLHCHTCGKVVGWVIPTGNVHHGISEVTIKMNKDGVIVDRLGSRYYFCTAHNENKKG